MSIRTKPHGSAGYMEYLVDDEKKELLNLIEKMSPSGKFIECEYVGEMSHPKSSTKKIVVEVMDNHIDEHRPDHPNIKGKHALCDGFVCYLPGKRIWVARSSIMGYIK